MMDGADMELKSFCFFLFDVNISAAFTIEVQLGLGIASCLG